MRVGKQCPRQSRSLLKNRHSDSLKVSLLALSQSLVKKVDDIAVDDDDE
jgi:hypothetical protein